ncbi:MAG: DNA gyrase C-terminal beta-propeller domain-containing protein, partial [Psittacicella sp.]
EDTVRPTGRNSMGVFGMKLSDSKINNIADKIVSLIVPKDTANNSSIITVTQSGYGKRTEINAYPAHNGRNGKGVISIQANSKNGVVVGAYQVQERDQLMLITDGGVLIRFKVSEIRIIGRNTKGVTLIRTADNESLIGIAKLCEDDSEVEIPLESIEE